MSTVSKREANVALALLSEFMPSEIAFDEKVLRAIGKLAVFIRDAAEPVAQGDAFFMVFAEGGHAPQCRHYTSEQAQQEAERIARKIGRPTYVLTATEKFTPTTTVATQPLRVQPTNVTPFGSGAGEEYSNHLQDSLTA
jgi:hypothetical protein